MHYGNKKNYTEIKYLPTKLRTKGMYLDAIKQNEKTIMFICKHINTNMIFNVYNVSSFYEETIIVNWKVIKHIDSKYKTYELCKKAVNINLDAIKYVPKIYKQCFNKN